MQKSILRLALVTALLLIIPLLGNQFVDGWNWDLFDFLFAGVLIFGTGLVYLLVARKSDTVWYRAGTGLAVASAFLLLWINAAVGIIGNGDLEVPNAMYLAVFICGFIGAFIARFQPDGMAHVLFGIALSLCLIAVIALIALPPPADSWTSGVAKVLALNVFFALLFATSALLFRRAARGFASR